MTIHELIELLEAEEVAFGSGDIPVAVDVTPPAEPNEITGLARTFTSQDRGEVLVLKMGWRIP